ncbi:MAG: glyceraldehyde-3-phosphate dehydrogenase [Pseudomonadales bacterium]|nr:glyceraldehyde-3-phosphate dehydrogenase [Pseudomonadales bacterium]
MTNENLEGTLLDWKNGESLAEAMIPMIGKLVREMNVVTYIYDRALVNHSVIGILKTHRFARKVAGTELTVADTYPIIKTLSELDLGPARIDVAKLAKKFDGKGSIENFVKKEVADLIGNRHLPIPAPQDVVLYGFGRIGRLLARLLIEKTGGGDLLRLKAIVVRKGGAANDIKKRASLLRRDSVHGPFQGTISLDEENNEIIANGNRIKIIYSGAPEEVDYTEYGINNAIVIDNTGVWRDEKGLSRHLKAKGVSRVLLTAPGKGDITNVVHGLNEDKIGDQPIISAASCTTNAIAPVLKVMNDKYGIQSGHVETVHAYTNDQNLLDNYHTGSRRGRAAPLNMVITETGAATAVAKALPELEGKLTGNAIRVPTANVSLAIMNLKLDNVPGVEELNGFLRECALHSSLSRQIDYVNSTEVVSSDFVGSDHAGVVDSEATAVTADGAVLYVWYDNEYGYSCQVVRVLQRMAGISYPVIPA